MNIATEAAADRVGVRELKDQLSRYLSLVRSGAEVIVTDHGRPVARLIPVGERAAVLDELVARGEVSAPRRGGRSRPKPIAVKGSVSELIADQRR
ncbi:MAG: type II toxin-antitoxin system prevent-host-death family antitoxin [Candidatus Dormiibacterota bacterium]